MPALASTPCAGANGDTLAITGLLGRGSYGAVYHGWCRSRGFVAVKVVPLGTDGKEKVLEEVSLMRAVGADASVVRLHAAFTHSAQVWMLLELCVGSVSDAIARRGGALGGAAARAVCAGALRGLRHLHDGCGVVHRDVKAANLLLAADGAVKLADFGIAKLQAEAAKTSTLIGTALWMAPEMITDSQCTAAVDVWALGIVLFECAQGAPPHASAPNPCNAMFKIASGRSPTLDAPEAHPPGLAATLARCVQIDPLQRPTAAALLADLAHEWPPSPRGDDAELEDMVSLLPRPPPPPAWHDDAEAAAAAGVPRLPGAPQPLYDGDGSNAARVSAVVGIGADPASLLDVAGSPPAASAASSGDSPALDATAPLVAPPMTPAAPSPNRRHTRDCPSTQPLNAMPTAELASPVLGPSEPSECPPTAQPLRATAPLMPGTPGAVGTPRVALHDLLGDNLPSTPHPPAASTAADDDEGDDSNWSRRSDASDWSTSPTPTGLTPHLLQIHGGLTRAEEALARTGAALGPPPPPLAATLKSTLSRRTAATPAGAPPPAAAAVPAPPLSAARRRHHDQTGVAAERRDRLVSAIPPPPPLPTIAAAGNAPRPRQNAAAVPGRTERHACALAHTKVNGKVVVMRLAPPEGRLPPRPELSALNRSAAREFNADPRAFVRRHAAAGVTALARYALSEPALSAAALGRLLGSADAPAPALLSAFVAELDLAPFTFDEALRLFFSLAAPPPDAAALGRLASAAAAAFARAHPAVAASSAELLALSLLTVEPRDASSGAATDAADLVALARFIDDHAGAAADGSDLDRELLRTVYRAAAHHPLRPSGAIKHGTLRLSKFGSRRKVNNERVACIEADGILRCYLPNKTEPKESIALAGAVVTTSAAKPNEFELSFPEVPLGRGVSAAELFERGAHRRYEIETEPNQHAEWISAIRAHANPNDDGDGAAVRAAARVALAAARRVHAQRVWARRDSAAALLAARWRARAARRRVAAAAPAPVAALAVPLAEIRGGQPSPRTPRSAKKVRFHAGSLVTWRSARDGTGRRSSAGSVESSDC